MWFIIPLGAIIGGPIGFFIALAIWFFLQSQDKTDHHTSQHTPAAAASSSPTARNLTINELMPTIRLVCFFLTQKRLECVQARIHEPAFCPILPERSG
jgi:hypothetical protein